jgi:TRAP-type C4-dicarboxylate transport system substrate-binding protein
MVSKARMAMIAALKAKRAWDRLPPEQRQALVESARKHGTVAAQKAADTARTHGPVVARRLAEAVEKARKAQGR